jgi:hypothetical protein
MSATGMSQGLILDLGFRLDSRAALLVRSWLLARAGTHPESMDGVANTSRSITDATIQMSPDEKYLCAQPPVPPSA